MLLDASLPRRVSEPPAPRGREVLSVDILSCPWGTIRSVNTKYDANLLWMPLHHVRKFSRLPGFLIILPWGQV